MDPTLGLSDAAIDGASAEFAAAHEAVSLASMPSAVELTGLTDVGTRVAEYVAALAVACRVLATSAAAARTSADACKSATDSTDSEVAQAGGAAAGGSAGAGAGAGLGVVR